MVKETNTFREWDPDDYDNETNKLILNDGNNMRESLLVEGTRLLQVPPSSQEGECQEEAQSTPVVHSKGNVLSVLDLEWDVGVYTAKRSTVNLV